MVIVETVFDKKTYLDYYRFDSITQDSKFRLAMILSILCVLGAGVLQVMGEVMFRNTALVAALVILHLWILQFFMKMSQNLKANRLGVRPIIMKYEFNSKKVVWNNKSANQYGSSKWAEVLKARKNGKYFYSYMTKIHALVVNTDHIVEGTKEQLAEIIKSNVKNCKL